MLSLTPNRPPTSSICTGSPTIPRWAPLRRLNNPPSAAAAVAPAAPSSNAAGAKGVDIAQLADHVYRILVRKLNNERDRRGY